MISGLFQTEAVAQSLANLACLEEVQQEGPALGHGGVVFWGSGSRRNVDFQRGELSDCAYLNDTR